MRVGIVVKVIPDKKIGFIRTEDLRDDVFFHFSKVEKTTERDLQDGDEVEFEIDELARIEKTDLRAIRVRHSKRHLSVRIRPGPGTEVKAQHHPNARQRRPTWRKKPASEDVDADTEDTPNTED